MARAYQDTRTTLDQLKTTKRRLSEQMYDMQTHSQQQQPDYEAFQRRIEAVDSRVCAVERKVEVALVRVGYWRSAYIVLQDGIVRTRSGRLTARLCARGFGGSVREGFFIGVDPGGGGGGGGCFLLYQSRPPGAPWASRLRLSF